MNRRTFGAALTAIGALSFVPRAVAAQRAPLFLISLAQWSLNRTIWGEGGSSWLREGVEGPASLRRGLVTGEVAPPRGELDPIDFAPFARREFDIDAVEYVNTFYFDKARDEAYLRTLKAKADDNGVRSVLIMCDNEGNLGNPDAEGRAIAVENHFKWVDAAAYLGCHAIRVNARSDAELPADEQRSLAADGLHYLATYADGYDIDVIVENHGGLSSDAQWLASTIEAADHSRVGTLPDFGNFKIDDERSYDPYKGVRELMPQARAVSAKSKAFKKVGAPETNLDYRRLMKIVTDAGYNGYVGIEYEGSGLSEVDGVRATKMLLERVREELSAS